MAVALINGCALRSLVCVGVVVLQLRDGPVIVFVRIVLDKMDLTLRADASDSVDRRAVGLEDLVVEQQSLPIEWDWAMTVLDQKRSYPPLEYI